MYTYDRKMSAKTTGPTCMHIDNYAKFNMYVSNANVRKTRRPHEQYHLPTTNQKTDHPPSGNRVTQYRHEAGASKVDHVSDIPEEKHHSPNREVIQGERQANSAPNRKDRPVPLPKVNSLVKHQNGNEPVSQQQQQTGYAGLTTKERDSRPGKFATSWANTRINDHLSNESSTDGKGKPPKNNENKTSSSNQFQFRASKPTGRQSKSPETIRKPSGKTAQSGTRFNDENVENQEEREKRDTETEAQKLTRLALNKANVRKPSTPRQTWNDNIRSVDTQSKQSHKQKYEPSFKPNINYSDDVFTVYTGLTKKDLKHRPNTYVSATTEDSYTTSPRSSPASSVPPWQKKDYILTQREARSYISMHAAYGNEDIQNQRKTHIINKLSHAQLTFIKNHNEMLKRREKQRLAAKQRQQKQLKYLRQKFEREQRHRFRSQYVTHRVLEHEIMNRDDYGLPEEVNDYDDDVNNTDEVNKSAKLKRQPAKPINNVSEKELRKRNKKKYEKMVNVYSHSSVYKNEKVPKMEGIDTVIILEKDKSGTIVEKRKMVSEIIKDAEEDVKEDSQKKTKVSGNNSKKAKTPKDLRGIMDDIDDDGDDEELNKSIESIDLDDDDDDIFERARKKYGLDVDDSLDTNSRI